MLQLWARVNLDAKAMKGYSAFPKHQYYRKLTIKLFNVKSRILVLGLTPLQKSSRCILQLQPTGAAGHSMVSKLD